ncbi:MAG TPA: 5-carboxymethyl-2-hydroxymuconate Delta-isomerase [Rhizobiaceae bacterium]|nr:5-carboxymethyl-2-hydroxymuconate Delta-isomerase [Rhizobiaceae bacterium]
MPHFVIEYSRGIEKTVDLDALMTATHEAGAESGAMKAEDIKVRAIPYDTFRFAGNIESFIHVTISLLEGRSDPQKEHLAVLLRERLARCCPDVDSISIDVRDMNAIAYKKRLLRCL